MLEDFSHVNEGEQIREDFSPEQMMALDISQFPRYEDTVKLIVCEHYSPGSTTQQKKKLIMMPSTTSRINKSCLSKRSIE